MDYFTLEQIIDTIKNNTQYNYKSLLFQLSLFLKDNRLYVKLIWNSKKENTKEIKRLLDIIHIDDIIKLMITNK